MENFNSIQNRYMKIINFFCEHLFERISLNQLKRFLSGEHISFKVFQKDFLLKGYAILDGQYIRMSFQSEFISKLKRKRDLSLILLLGPQVVKELMLIRERLLQRWKGKILSIILIGSLARDKMRPSSDIDLLLVTKHGSVKRVDCDGLKVQVQSFLSDEFDRLFMEGDELVLWTLKYGLILHDEDFVFKYYSHGPTKIGEKSISVKTRMIHRLVSDIGNSGEIPTARLRVKIFRLIFQGARLTLILHGEIPLSRWELAGQLRKYSVNFSKLVRKSYKSESLSRAELMILFKRFLRVYCGKIGHL